MVSGFSMIWLEVLHSFGGLNLLLNDVVMVDFAVLQIQSQAVWKDTTLDQAINPKNEVS